MTRAPPPMENGSAKKARIESPTGQVKQEADKASRAGALVAVDSGATGRVDVAVRIDKAVLHCPLCTLPLKPPIFQCGVGHLTCGSCHGQLASSQCHSCDGGGAYGRCFAMDAFVSSAMVPCPHAAYGCRSEIAYYQLSDHQSACPHAPCVCPEPGCAFLGAPAALRDHLAAAPHSWPVEKVRYGDVLRFRAPESEPRRLLVAEEDGRVFLLAVGDRGAGAVPVTVACARARAAAAEAGSPQYMCKMWATGRTAPGTGKVESVLVDMEVPSGGLAADEETTTSLWVPRNMLRGATKQILVSVRIDRVSD